MTCHVRMSLHLLLLSNYLLLQVHTIEPIPLWKAIEKAISLEKVDKRECTRIILYNTAAERYVLDGNITESKYIFVKIDFDSSFASTDILDQVQRTTNDTIKKAIDKRSMHCFLAISMVNTSQEVVDMESQRMSPTEMQEKKLGYSLELIKLLQFKSPVNQRSLILVRYGNSSTDFGQCRKSIYQRYPVRLVPLWEQALFDFFPSALAIHAVTSDKVVQTRREEGNLLWMCEDIVKRINDEKDCMSNMTKACEAKKVNGEFSTVSFNMTTCKGYTPRM